MKNRTALFDGGKKRTLGLHIANVFRGGYAVRFNPNTIGQYIMYMHTDEHCARSSSQKIKIQVVLFFLSSWCIETSYWVPYTHVV